VPPNLPRAMPWQIYHAYLQGPSAFFRLFEDTFGRQALYVTSNPDQQRREIADLSEHQTALLWCPACGKTKQGEFSGADIDRPFN
jgi:hypothetical protein